MENPLKRIPPFWRNRFAKWFQIIFIVLLVAYGLTGFFIVPDLINKKAQEFVAEKFQRKLSFTKVSFNPFTLTADFEGMQLSEHGSENGFASFDHLLVDFSAESYFRLAPVVEKLTLTNPKIRLERQEDNRYNIDDFVAFAMEPKEDDSSAKFAVNNIQIKNGLVEFDDKPKNKRHFVDELNLTIPFISSLPSQVNIFVDLALSAKVNNEKIEISGKTRPFFRERDGTVNLKLDSIDLVSYISYLPFKPGFKLKDGKLSTDLEIGFVKPEEGKMGLFVEGRIDLDAFQLADLNGADLLKIPELDVKIDKSDVLSGNLAVNLVELKYPVVSLDRNRKGQWNFERMFATVNGKSKPQKETSQADASGQDGQGMPFNLALDKLTVTEGQLQIRDQTNAVPANFSVKNFGLVVDKLVLDLLKRDMTVEKIVSANTDIKFVHGKLDIADKDAKKTAKKTMDDAAAQAGFNYSIARFELDDWSLYFENRVAGKPVVTRVTKLDVSADHISSKLNEPVAITVAANINEKGKLDIRGTVEPVPLKADLDLDIKNVDIRAVQPYIEEYVNLSLRQANLSLAGKLKFAEARNRGLEGQFTGNAGLSRLVTVDQVTRQPFVNWGDLSLKGVRVNLSPLSVVVDQVTLNNLMARVILSSKGRLNLQDVMRSETGGQKSLTQNEEKDNGKTPAAGTAVAQQTAQQSADSGQADQLKADKKNYSILIKKWLIRNGKIRFSDNFIQPRYTANLVNLRGSINNLSTDASKQATVDVKGRVNGAPLTIAGELNPLSDKLALDIKANVKGMELAQFSAYSGKYIGYGIEKGKLSFDVHYKVLNDQLTAENSLVLDQLTLGDEVESADAVHLPVRLALALLKDRNGVIDINLPVGGSLNDPEFSVGGIVFKMFVNLLTKAVTAPFRLLGALVGNDAELSFVTFEPGSHAITASEQKKLEALAKALENRPALTLEITGKYDPVVDSKLTIMKKLREMKAKDLGKKAGDAKVVVTDKEYPDLLKRLYSNEDFEKPKNWIGFSKSVPVPEMEKLLSQHFSGKSDDLIQLANQRARVVKEWLITDGKIPEERLFLLASKAKKTEGNDSGNRVDFSLK